VVARQVNAERIVLFGWSRAILLQAAHPLIAAGVADHSHFSAGARAAISRLHSTVAAMRSLAFGDADRHRQTVEAIRAIHRRVHGTLRETTGVFAGGAYYSAEDPDLLLWVHATQVESTAIIYDRLVRPLTIEERDEYCDEAREIALELGARPEDVPRSWTDLLKYLETEYDSGRIAVGRDARAIADAVLFPPMTAVPPPVAWANRVLTIGLLPARVREQYRYGWDDHRARQLERTLAALRQIRLSLPRAVAWWSDARRTATPPVIY
jgi:uncharacterized protein (DUF2236 family)